MLNLTLLLLSILLGTVPVNANNGIEFSTYEINNFKEGSSIDVNVKLTEPIICPTIENCNMVLYFDSPDVDVISISPCYLLWSYQDWDKEQSVTVKYISQYRNIPNGVYTLQPRLDTTQSYFYEGVQPEPITIRTLSIPTKQCSGTGDPHYTTFDGYYYHYYGIGKEWLVRTRDSNNLKIQTITHGSPYSRNCALAMAENGNYFVINVCGGSISVNTISRNDNNRITVSRSGNSYYANFESGVSATFSYWGNNANVYITLPGNYFDSIEGICGNWDNNPSNEGNPGYRIYNWNDLPTRWRVYDNEDMFTSNVDKLNRLIDETIVSSTFADDAKKTCDYELPTYKRPILRSFDVEDLTDLLKSIDFVEQPLPDLSFDVVDESVENIEELIQNCEELAIKEELESCSFDFSHLIEACIEDIQLIRDPSVVEETWEAIQSSCLQKIVTESSSDEEVEQIVEKFCVASCPLKSKCREGICRCVDTSMEEPLCDVYKNSTPSLIDIHPKYINYNNVYNVVRLDVANMTFSRKATCVFDNSVEKHRVDGQYLGNNIVVCSLGMLKPTHQSNYSVYLEEDLTRNTKYLFFHNNDCLKCDESCELKSDKCFIEPTIDFSVNCYRERQYLDHCGYCANNQLNVNWTKHLCGPQFSTYSYKIDSFVEGYFHIPDIVNIFDVFGYYNQSKELFQLYNNDKSCHEGSCYLTFGSNKVDIRIGNVSLSSIDIDLFRLTTTQSEKLTTTEKQTTTESERLTTEKQTTTESEKQTTTESERLTTTESERLTTTDSVTSTSSNSFTTTSEQTTSSYPTTKFFTTTITPGYISFEESTQNKTGNILAATIPAGILLLLLVVVIILVIKQKRINTVIRDMKSQIIVNESYLDHDTTMLDNYKRELYYTPTGTYKVIHNNSEYKMVVKKKDGVYEYDIGTNDYGHHIYMEMTPNNTHKVVKNPIYFKSLDEMVYSYSHGVINPLYECLQTPIELDTELYTFNNVHITNAEAQDSSI